jgi:hypothetical protein
MLQVGLSSSSLTPMLMAAETTTYLEELAAEVGEPLAVKARTRTPSRDEFASEASAGRLTCSSSTAPA